MADEDGEKPADQAPEAKATEGGSAAGDSEKPASAEKAAGGEASVERKKKKKKKKKRSAEASDDKAVEESKGPVLGPEGWERPGFVLDFPSDPELDRVVRAYELGNYAFVREHGKKLADGASDAGVKSAATELLRRIEPDPLVKYLFAMTIALFLFMVFYAYRSHGH